MSEDLRLLLANHKKDGYQNIMFNLLKYIGEIRLLSE